MKKIYYSLMALALSAAVLTSCEDVPSPYDIPSSSHTGGDGGSDDSGTIAATGAGTLDNPYNVAAANDVCKALEQSSTSATYLSDDVYVKGIISLIEDTEISSYGNITYYISDTGETTSQLEVYRGYGLGGDKFTSLDEIHVGDTVIVKGKLQNWLGKQYEFTSGSSICYLNGKKASEDSGTTGVAAGTGAQGDPFNVAGIIKYTSALASNVNSTDKVYFKGIVSKTKDISATYGNATFYISEDGTTDGDQFYVFRALGVGGAAIASESDVEVGDTVVMYGTVVNYMGNTPETVQKESYIYSIKKAKSEPTPTPTPTPSSAGVNIDGTTVTLASGLTAGNESVTIDLNTLSLENAAAVETVTFSDGSTIVFDKGTGTNAPKFYTATKGVRVYGGNTLTFNGKSTIAQIVITCDSYSGTDYVGQTTATVTFDGKTAVYTNAGSATTQLRAQTITIYYAASSAAKRYAKRRR